MGKRGNVRTGEGRSARARFLLIGAALLVALVANAWATTTAPAEAEGATTEPSRIVQWLEARGLGPAAIVIVIAMLPIFELRGAIPVGYLVFGMPLWQVYVLSIIGNLIPIIPIILMIGPVSDFLIRRSTLWRRFFDWVFERTRKRGGDLVEKYEAIGLAIFVAIPLPVTGAWTGSLLAFLMRIRARRAFPAILCGVLVAGVVVSLVCTGALGIFRIFVGG